MATPMTKQHDIFPRPSTGKASPSLFPNDETNITSSLRDQEAVARALKEETQRLEEGFRIRDEIASLKTANRNLKDGKECAEKEKASAEHAKVLAEKGKILAEKEKALAEDEKRQVEKEVKALKETISKAEATIEKLERFDGCEMYFYNLATQTAIDYDSTKTEDHYTHGFELQIGNDFQGWEIQEIPNGPINQPPALYIRNIKSKRCLEFRAAGTGQTLYASAMKNGSGHRPDDSQHWHFRPVGLGVVGCVHAPFHFAHEYEIWDGDEACPSKSPSQGSGVKILSATPDASAPDQQFNLIFRVLRENE